MRDLTGHEPLWLAELSSSLLIARHVGYYPIWAPGPPPAGTLFRSHWALWWTLVLLLARRLVGCGCPGWRPRPQETERWGLWAGVCILCIQSGWGRCLGSDSLCTNNLGLSAEHLFSRACLSVTAHAHPLMALPLSFVWCRFYLKWIYQRWKVPVGGPQRGALPEEHLEWTFLPSSHLRCPTPGAK